MSEEKPQLKKQYYPINDTLRSYLEKYKRLTKTRVYYDDLMRFQGSVVVYDRDDKDTLWVRVYYNDSDRTEIDHSLKKIYTLLHSDGDESNIEYLNVDYVDFCTFGNSKPFRVKVRNKKSRCFQSFWS